MTEWQVTVRATETFTVLLEADNAPEAKRRARELVREPPADDAVESVTSWSDRKATEVTSCKKSQR